MDQNIPSNENSNATEEEGLFDEESANGSGLGLESLQLPFDFLRDIRLAEMGLRANAVNLPGGPFHLQELIEMSIFQRELGVTDEESNDDDEELLYSDADDDSTDFDNLDSSIFFTAFGQECSMGAISSVFPLSNNYEDDEEYKMNKSFIDDLINNGVSNVTTPAIKKSSDKSLANCGKEKIEEESSSSAQMLATDQIEADQEIIDCGGEVICYDSSANMNFESTTPITSSQCQPPSQEAAAPAVGGPATTPSTSGRNKRAKSCSSLHNKNENRDSSSTSSSFSSKRLKRSFCLESIMRKIVRPSGENAHDVASTQIGSENLNDSINSDNGDIAAVAVPKQTSRISDLTTTALNIMGPTVYTSEQVTQLISGPLMAQVSPGLLQQNSNIEDYERAGTSRQTTRASN